MEQLRLTFNATDQCSCAAQAGVYVLEAMGTGLVKIGFTKDLEKRLADLRYMTAAPVKLLMLLPGGRREERELHRRFHEHRSHGEWFHHAPIQSALEALNGSPIEILSDRLVCIDCGAIRSEHSRMRAKRCKACEMRRRHAERQQSAQYAEWRRVRTTCMECGGAIAVDLNRGLSKTGLCKPCAMRKAWATDTYRAARRNARV